MKVTVPTERELLDVSSHRFALPSSYSSRFPFFHLA
jgi:hypothetical protein